MASTFANVGALRCPGEPGTVGSAWPLTTAETQGNWNLVPHKSQVLPQKGLGDRRQEWVLELALPTNDTLDETVSRNPKWLLNAPKAVTQRVKTLASLNAQGMHFQPTLVSSFQQGWMVTSAQEQTPCVEGEVEQGVWPHQHSAATGGE
jgi:hypothetical protein